MDIGRDPAKAAFKFRKHGVRFSDVEAAFYDDQALSMQDSPSSGEERFLLIGMDALGRIRIDENPPASFPPDERQNRSARHMRKEYDFSRAKRGTVAKAKGKTRITIYLDDDVLEAYRTKGDELGRGYQTLINEALRASLSRQSAPVDARTLRRIVREELEKAG